MDLGADAHFVKPEQHRNVNQELGERRQGNQRTIDDRPSISLSRIRLERDGSLLVLSVEVGPIRRRVADKGEELRFGRRGTDQLAAPLQLPRTVPHLSSRHVLEGVGSIERECGVLSKAGRVSAGSTTLCSPDAQ